jgi:hypothetical protein
MKKFSRGLELGVCFPFVILGILIALICYSFASGFTIVENCHQWMEE